MSGLIFILRDNIEALVVIAGAAAAVYRFAIRPVWRGIRKSIATLDNVEKLLGYNNGLTVFDYLSIISSLSDVIDQPSARFDEHGEAREVNPAFTEHTGLGLSSVKHGGWRQLFASTGQQEWDHAVVTHTVFVQPLQVGPRAYRVVAKPIFNGTKFLGWRARLTAVESGVTP
jgi:hypothetical protein